MDYQKMKDNQNMMNSQMMANNLMGMNNPMMMNNLMGMNNPMMANNLMGMNNPMMANNLMGMNNPMLANNLMGMNNPMMTNNLMGMNNPMMSQEMGMNSMMSQEMGMNNPMMMDNQMMMNNQMLQMMNQMMMMNTMMHNKDEEKYNKIDEEGEKFRKYLFNFYYDAIRNYKKVFYNSKKLENKIYINYYNKIRKEIYLDFNDKMKDICGYILSSIGLCHNNSIKIYKRKEKNQTTINIIENPNVENDFFFYIDKYLFLEYKNKEIHFPYDIHKLSDISGVDFGLEDGDEISLKLDDENIKSYFSGEMIDVIFRYKVQSLEDLEDLDISFPCGPKELLSDVVNRYFIKTGIYLDHHFKFIFDAKNLSLDDIVGEKLSNRSNIFVYNTNGLKGAGGIGFLDFVDVKTGKTKKLEFNKNAPKWRCVKKGLNIFGICENSECEAYKKEVVHIVGLGSDEEKLKFDLKNEVTNIKCPICPWIIKANTCGFYKCEYQFRGKKITKGKLEDYESEPKETKSNDFEYFDPNENGKTEWYELLIYVLPIQEIKYKKN